jgi:hypothetical protein
MSIKICSFDVGIINLAYSIITKHNDTDFTIDKWDIINIADDGNNNIINCTHANSSNKVCNKKASYSLKLGNNVYFFCKNHLDKHELLLKDYEKKNEILEAKKMGHLCNHKIKTQNCSKKASFKVGDDICCSNHYKMDHKLIKVNKIKDNKPQDNAISLYTKLNLIPELLNVDEILIENQPSYTNPKMKTISVLLFGYFVIKGIIEKIKNESTINRVDFISPSNKLKLDKDVAEDTIKKGKTQKEEYKLTKALGIKFCSALIKDKPESVKRLSEFKKKDDLCDAFLHGYHHLFCKNGVPSILKDILKDETILVKPKKNKLIINDVIDKSSILITNSNESDLNIEKEIEELSNSIDK